MEPEEPAEPPLKKQAVLAPYDNPDWKGGGRFTWAVCESLVMEWAVGDPVMWLDNKGCEAARELCTDLQQSLGYSWFLALSFFLGLNFSTCMMHVSALWLTFRFSTTKVPSVPQDGW